MQSGNKMRKCQHQSYDTGGLPRLERKNICAKEHARKGYEVRTRLEDSQAFWKRQNDGTNKLKLLLAPDGRRCSAVLQ
jgi:hypothetical protein